MSEGLEKLRSIGAQKIHEQTHIAHKYVQAILHESFEEMQKVQLMGFLSILEREYDVDLAPLRMSALEYFDRVEESFQEEEPAYKKRLYGGERDHDKRGKTILLFVGIVIVAAIGYLMMAQKQAESSGNMTQKEEASIPAVQKKSPISVVDRENNESNETQKSQREEPKPVVKKVEHHELTILPRTKVWVGIIDLENGKKRQTVTSKAIDLNASKNYLLTFGHGYIDIRVDGNTTRFKDPKNVKFLYEEGKLEKIGNKEFRAHNKGKLW